MQSREPQVTSSFTTLMSRSQSRSHAQLFCVLLFGFSRKRETETSFTLYNWVYFVRLCLQYWWLGQLCVRWPAQASYLCSWRTQNGKTDQECLHVVYDCLYYYQCVLNKSNAGALHIKRVELPQDGLVQQHGRRTPIWPPWRHVYTLYNYFRLDYQRRRNRENPCFDLTWYLTLSFINSYIFVIVRDVTLYRYFFYNQVAMTSALILSLYRMLI